jgi:hypothetical protein
MPINYETENKENYLHRDNSGKYKAPVIDYSSGSWMPENTSFNSHTTHQRELPLRPVEPFIKAEPKVKGGFSLGDHRNYYQTEFTQKY